MADAPADTTETTTQPDDATPPADELGDAGKRALDDERKARRDAERKLKAATAELEQARQASMTETERAVSAAREEGRLAGVREGSGRVVAAEIRAAAAGRSVDVDTLLEGIDTTRFLDDAGEVDTGAIAAWIDKLAPPATETPRRLDLGQGARGGTPPALNDDPLLKALVSKVGTR